MNTCIICGSPLNTTYKSDKFCSKHCCSIYCGKQSVIKRKERGTFQKNLEHARTARTFIYENIPGTCKFCGKLCHNQNSLINHERLCKQNPNRPNLEVWKKKFLETFSKNKENHLKTQFIRNKCICPFCEKELLTTKTGFCQHKIHCKKNPNYKPGSFLEKHHTEETKRKISLSQKQAHIEGRTSSWIGRRKRSYAEQSWFNIFSKEFGEENFKNNFFVNECHYWLDFAWPEKKIYFEVDGKIHFTNEGIEKDKIRTERLANAGWKLIGRCNWSEYQKLSFEEKEKFVESIVSQIKNFMP